jgi:hypothetical protein
MNKSASGSVAGGSTPRGSPLRGSGADSFDSPLFSPSMAARRSQFDICFFSVGLLSAVEPEG